MPVVTFGDNGVPVYIYHRLPPLHMYAKCLFKTIFGHKSFISEQIFKFFATIFRTFRLQKDDMVIIFFNFLWCFRKVRF